MGAAALTFTAGLASLFAPVLRRRVPNPQVRQRRGLAGALAYGILYSVATITTSAGPLVLLLSVAAAMGRPVYGAAISVGYGVGRGIPFLVLGLLAGRFSSWIGRIERGRRTMEVVSGLALLVLALYFLRFAMITG